MRLGIDFGTTRTVVAAVESGRQPVVSFTAELGAQEWLPGLALERDGELAFGWDAAAALEGGLAGGGVVRSLKRAITGLAPDDTIDELPSRPGALALVTAFASHLARMLRESSSLEIAPGEPLDAMLAVPANATSRQRWITIEAFRRAGFGVLGVMNEPTAAAIEYAARHLRAGGRSPKRYVVIYDLGGGTFDTSAVSLAGRRFELLATEGLARVGGDDLDATIAQLALDAAGAEMPAPGSAARALVLDAARAAKEAMKPSSRHVMVELAGREPILLSSAGVLAACEPLVARTMELLARLFERLPAHGIDTESPRELGAVYVVGGGAAFPGVARALRAAYARKVQLAPAPHAATAVGLAVAADPDGGVYVHEAVTRHFGVWREGEGGREKVFDPIFGKDDRHAGDDARSEERVVARRYRPRHAVGHLRFLECSQLDADGGPSGELTPFREILFPYDPALRDQHDLERVAPHDGGLTGEVIEETYRYGAHGDVSVRIENLTRGYARTYELGRLGSAGALDPRPRSAVE